MDETSMFEIGIMYMLNLKGMMVKAETRR